MTEKNTKNQFITGTGRRKTAISRIFLHDKKGEFFVNDKDIKEYFPSDLEQATWVKPFHLVGIAHPESKFSGTIKIQGSGKSAQLAALIHSIAHALSKMSEEWSVILRKQGFLTRDPRMVERKKYNLHKARKATQYSKR
jgi:small subunit ribosomal protein S9